MICGFAKEDRFLHDRLNHGHDSRRILSSKQVVGNLGLLSQRPMEQSLWISDSCHVFGLYNFVVL